MFPNEDVKVKQFEKVDELSGKLGMQDVDDKLMRSVLENDKEKIDKGRIMVEALNMGMSSFTPDLMFENLVRNYSMAKKLYGERLLRLLTGYDPGYIDRNIKIPEFKRELMKKLEEGIGGLKQEGLIDKQGFIINKGLELASLILYIEELDNITPKGSFGEYVHKKTASYGSPKDVKNYRKGNRYKDIAIKSSIKKALRRGHSKLLINDLKTYERHAKGQTYIIYGMDASGSMRGKKIEASKKAGIALAYKAIERKDKVGLLVFKDKVEEEIKPTLEFPELVKSITKVRASKETNFVNTIRKAVELFPTKDVTKHFMLLTDALPTIGSKPEEETLKAVAEANETGITISVIGISLDDKGKKLAKQIVEIGRGRFYVVNNIEELDRIVLEDYTEIV